MNRSRKSLHALAAQIVALRAKARGLGLFADDRELLSCPQCGLQEDVTFSGMLITNRPEAASEDTGMRFEEISRDRFRCPSCGATVGEVASTEPAAEKAKKGQRSCRAGKSRS